MFELILANYKKKMSKKLPVGIRIKLVVILIAVFTIEINYFINVEWLSFAAMVVLIIVLVMLIFNEFGGKKYDLEKCMNDRNKTFDEFLKENEISEICDRVLLREKCCEYLKENSKSNEIIMPFFTMSVIPVILIFVQLIVSKASSEENIEYIIFVTLLEFIVYVLVKKTDDILSQLIDKDNYYVKRLRDDLDTYEFLLRKDGVNNSIEK